MNCPEDCPNEERSGGAARYERTTTRRNPRSSPPDPLTGFRWASDSPGDLVVALGTGQSVTTYNNPYNVQQCGKVRGAYTERLGSWGYWSNFSNTSCQTPPIPAPSSCTVTTVSSSSIRVAVSGGVGVQTALAGGGWVGGSVRTITGLRPETTYTVYGRSTANGGASGNVGCSGATAAIPLPAFPGGCVTSTGGNGSVAGSRLATVSLCDALKVRINASTGDPMKLTASWTHQAYDDVTGKWGQQIPTYNNVQTSTKASSFGVAQALSPPVTKVRFTIVLTNGQGSATRTVTVNL